MRSFTCCFHGLAGDSVWSITCFSDGRAHDIALSLMEAVPDANDIALNFMEAVPDRAPHE